MSRRAAGCLAVALALWGAPAAAAPDRIFYRGAVWLDTAPAVQRLSVHAVLRAWETLAERAELFGYRQREFVRLHECLLAAGYSTGALVDRLTRFGLTHRARVFYSLTDFAAEGFQELCPRS